MSKYLTFRIAIIGIIVFTVTFLYFSQTHIHHEAEPPQSTENEEELIEESQEVVLIPEAKLIFKTYYEECGHLIEEEKPLLEDLIGANRKKIEEKYPKWTIISFEKDLVELKKVEEGLCPEHYFIGIKDGYVTLFQGKPGTSNAKIIEKTDVSVDSLRQTDKLLLEKGIEVYGREQLKKVREGFTN